MGTGIFIGAFVHFHTHTDYTLLAQTQALQAPQTPPQFSFITGPQSVIFIWSASFTALPDDDEAEAMVAHPELVVYSYIDEPEADGEQGEQEGLSSEKRMGKRRQIGSFQSQSLRRQFRVKGRTETMVACAVQALRIDMAVYWVRM